MAWEEGDLSVLDVIYVYPVGISEEEIIRDITLDHGQRAIISHEIGESEFRFQNGERRTGFEFELETVLDAVYLDSRLENGERTNLSGGEYYHTFEFQIVFGVRTNIDKTRDYFIEFMGEDLRLEIETRAELLSRGAWTDTQHETIMLRNAAINHDHPILDLIPHNTSDNENFVHTGNVQRFEVPETGLYRLEVWGADGGAVESSSFNSRGGFSSGVVELTEGEIIYIYVGGRGQANAGAGITNFRRISEEEEMRETDQILEILE